MRFRLINLLFCFFIITHSNFSQVVTVLYLKGDLSKESSKDHWKNLEKDDEIDFNERIQLKGENSEVYLRINGNEKLLVSGPVRKGFLKDVISFEKENNPGEETTSFLSSITNFFNYHSKAGPGSGSFTSRGYEEIITTNPNKKQFYISNKVNVLRGHNAVICWEPSGKKNEIYKIKLLKFEDTTFISNDTLITINSNLVNECSPCDLKILKPIDTYNNSTIKLFYSYLSDSTSKKIAFLDDLILKEPNISLYKYAKIQLLIYDGFIANAHYYYLKYLSNDNNSLKNEYQNFLNSLFNYNLPKK